MYRKPLLARRMDGHARVERLVIPVSRAPLRRPPPEDLPTLVIWVPGSGRVTTDDMQGIGCRGPSTGTE